MSTRGCVATGNEDEWSGYFNHYDSYPTNLGKEVWETLNEGGDILDVADTEEEIKSDENPDPLFLEWIYIHNKGRGSLIVLANVGVSIDTGIPNNEAKEMEEGYWDHGHCIYKHFKVGEFSLGGLEPNWGKLEKEHKRIIKENLLEKIDSDTNLYAEAMAESLKGANNTEEEIIMLDRKIQGLDPL